MTDEPAPAPPYVDRAEVQEIFAPVRNIGHFEGLPQNN